jgi:hypothetical protein
MKRPEPVIPEYPALTRDANGTGSMNGFAGPINQKKD